MNRLFESNIIEENQKTKGAVSISDLLPKIEEETFNKNRKKIDFEFQDLCLEMEPFYGKLVWTLPYKIGYTEDKIRRAHKVCSEKGIFKLPYLIGVIKNLK